MSDIVAHLTRQMVFSRATFGPGARTKGVLDHISKEVEEVREHLSVLEDCDKGSETEGVALENIAKEAVDLVILSLDGLTRALWARYPNSSAELIADIAWYMILSKQGKNELRNWPDWRTADPNKAIEHIKGTHD